MTQWSWLTGHDGVIYFVNYYNGVVCSTLSQRWEKVVPGVRDSGSARVGEVVVTGGGNGSIARWVMGEQKAIVVESGLTKPRVVMCVGARVLVMGDQGELVSYNTRTNRCSRLCSSVPGIILGQLEVNDERVVMCGLVGQAVTDMLQL